MCGCNKKRLVVASTQPRASNAPPRATIAPPRASNAGSVVPPVTIKPAADTGVWGPHLWKVLHIVATFASTDTTVAHVLAIFAKLRGNLPCPECSVHYTEWYNSHKIRTHTAHVKRSRFLFQRPVNYTLQIEPAEMQQSIMKWVTDLHNDVNKRVGVPVWSYSDANAKYGGDKAARIREAKAAIDALKGILENGVHKMLGDAVNAL